MYYGTRYRYFVVGGATPVDGWIWKCFDWNRPLGIEETHMQRGMGTG